MSQAYFAALLNVSPKTVQSWEQGIREPSDSSLWLLQIVEKNPAVVREIEIQGNGGRMRSISKVSVKAAGEKTAKH